jgi:hypothetical protein
MKRIFSIILAFTLIFVASGCQAVARPRPGTNGPPNTRWSPFVITEDLGDKFNFTNNDASKLNVFAEPGNSQGNTRLGFINNSTPTARDAESCMSWNGPFNTMSQPGIILRHRQISGGDQAIMVTNSIMFGWRAGINVHLVNTNPKNIFPGAAKHNAYAQIGSISSSLVGDPNRQKLPWTFCARVVGNKISIKGWSSTTAEPAWNSTDTSKVGHFTLPNDYVYSGKHGVYAGHIAPSFRIDSESVSVRAL